MVWDLLRKEFLTELFDTDPQSQDPRAILSLLRWIQFRQGEVDIVKDAIRERFTQNDGVDLIDFVARLTYDGAVDENGEGALTLDENELIELLPPSYWPLEQIPDQASSFGPDGDFSYEARRKFAAYTLFRMNSIKSSE
ncbi:hypothetical protein NJ76_27755 [Rhodococcus sp. IITR03]|nr:hypothetical protein NJ76_27755 [Rhodococcus sp. IITR03]